MPTSCKPPKPSPPHGTHPLPLGGSHGEKITFTDSDVSDDDFSVSPDMSACELVYALTDIYYAYKRYEDAVDTLLELWALTVTASCGTHNGFSMRYLGERVEADVLTARSSDRQVRAWLRDYFSARKHFSNTFADLFHFARSREFPEEEDIVLVEDLTSVALQVSNFLTHWALGCHVLKECELLDMPELSGHWRYHLVNLLKVKGFTRRVNTDIPFMYRVSDDFKKGVRERSLAGLNSIFAPVNGEPATEEIARRVGVPTSRATILPNGMALDTLHLNVDVWSVVLSYA